MNLEKLKDGLEKIPITPITMLVLGWLGYDYYSFENFDDSPYRMRLAEIDVLEKDAERLTRELKEAEEFLKNLEQKRAELRALAVKLDEMRATLTEELDVPALIKMLVAESKRVGLTLRSIRPTEPKTHEYYVEQPFELSFKSVFVQFLIFLQRLSTVERIVRIENLTLARSGSSAARYVTVEGTVQIKAYKYLGSKADEVAKSGGSQPDAIGADASSGAHSGGGSGGTQ